jgi:hypothetical protein
MRSEGALAFDGEKSAMLRFTNNFAQFKPNPNQLRWKPFPLLKPVKEGGKEVDFVDVNIFNYFNFNFNFFFN